MRELPAALTFDLDPDIFDESISSSNARTRLGWRGISEGVPAIRDALDAFAPQRHGRVDDALQIDLVAPPVSHISSNQDLGLRVQDAVT